MHSSCCTPIVHFTVTLVQVSVSVCQLSGLSTIGFRSTWHLIQLARQGIVSEPALSISELSTNPRTVTDVHRLNHTPRWWWWSWYWCLVLWRAGKKRRGKREISKQNPDKEGGGRGERERERERGGRRNTRLHVTSTAPSLRACANFFWMLHILS